MNFPDCKERFRMKARGWAIMVAAALRSLPGSLSYPTAFFSGIDWSGFNTKSVVTEGNVNIGIPFGAEGISGGGESWR